MVADVPTRGTECVLEGETSPAHIHSHFVYLPCAHLFAKELHKQRKLFFSPSLGFLPLQQAGLEGSSWEEGLLSNIQTVTCFRRYLEAGHRVEKAKWYC